MPDNKRHTIVKTGLIVSLCSFAVCGLFWLGVAFGVIKRVSFYPTMTHVDTSVNVTLDLLLWLVGGMIAGIVIGGIAKVIMPSRSQAA